MSNTWDSEELTLKNELKLIDDSYYRVYDDNDYEIWRERMFSIIENQFKATEQAASVQENDSKTGILNSIEASLEQSSLTPESSVNEINPIKPAVLELPNEVIFDGINNQPVNLDSYNSTSSWGMRFLLREIDMKGIDESLKTQYKRMLLDNKSGKSKWSNSNRLGQAELYHAIEKVLLDLKSYTPYSIPFLVKVSKKDVPDYYNVIKKPMDLGSIGKKIKNQEYISKQQFADDLNLIYLNCFAYNTAEDSIYRQHIQMLRDKWTYLLKTVPDIIVGKYVPEDISTPLSSTSGISQKESFKASSSVLTKSKGKQQRQTEIQQQKQASMKLVKSPSIHDMDDGLDDLDDLLNTHLESLSDIESCPSPKKQKRPDVLQVAHFNLSQNVFPGRSEQLMVKYSSDLRVSRMDNTHDQMEEKHHSSFIFPELVYFYNTVPDAHLKMQTLTDVFPSNSSSSYSTAGAMNRLYENFRILQSVRDIRKHLLESSRLEPPNLEHLNSPTSRFDDFEVATVRSPCQAQSILKKIISLYLAQIGFEYISNSALHAFYELLDANLINFFDTFKTLTAQFSKERDSADILRLVLLQMNIKHLSDLEVIMSETSYAKTRLEHLLDEMKARLFNFQSTQNQYHQKDTSENDCTDQEEDGDEDGDDEGDEDNSNDPHRSDHQETLNESENDEIEEEEEELEDEDQTDDD